MTDWLDVNERSAVAEARRRANEAADRAGLNPHARERAAIVATEAATNILKHAGRGRIALLAPEEAGTRDVFVLAVDKGPGIADLDRMSQDGFSTTGSSGTGLGAMQRQADTLDIHTTADGTVLAARFAVDTADEAGAEHVEVAALMDRYPGAAVCGDDWAVRREAGALVVMVCDGLGHGPGAHEAALAVRDAFLGGTFRAPGDALVAMSDAATRTRGAVAMVVRIDREDARLTAAGLGNIAGLIASPGQVRRLVSRDGRLGGSARRPQEQDDALAPGETLVLHSDGIRTLRNIHQRAGLLTRSPLTIAATLLRDEARGNDDASVLVLRRPAGATPDR